MTYQMSCYFELSSFLERLGSDCVCILVPIAGCIHWSCDLYTGCIHRSSDDGSGWCNAAHNIKWILPHGTCDGSFLCHSVITLLTMFIGDLGRPQLTTGQTPWPWSTIPRYTLPKCWVQTHFLVPGKNGWYSIVCGTLCCYPWSSPSSWQTPL